MAITFTGARRAAPPAGRVDAGDDFAPRPTSAAELPAPEPILHNLSVGVLEVFAGVRDVEQLARWLTEDAYRKLLTRANLAARARSARGVAPSRPVHNIIRVHQSSPADGVVEGVVIVRGPARTRAIALRLEGVDHRWRATSLALL
ncbi:MAG: 3-hydroxyacyl-CoA dehydrogenase [Microbacterium sp.]|uniref:3-hydroxyacyl-CoA dehydrogenase n=1 Tax=Microbacterium ginsengisoli TaxID=400772 RepID=A0A0F0LQY8_9MICO|nr:MULTISPECIES: Rv3235 family protein [Microbacterium]MAL06996.1 3-hydroxyacyl-CoA dehydrogenase [Microbacterium sp.]MCK9914924.1 Rv3235 family protein [Microbacteriaceae bacterium K1510]KJL35637.1 hypothetical protein RR49_02396 [Microbacterium ginsengisoli]KQS00193.1 3-hydroxyacyl-CoA dehydrogenase [Microbacterium sp. Leaf347]KQS02851.1 3-hydroxyacyl-CoA dehydrogenase [Microbacterium sp. Leaf351]